MSSITGTQSSSHIIIDSRDREAGTPSEYWITLQPKIRNVVMLRFLSFSGGAFPYTFKEPTTYTFTSIQYNFGTTTAKDITILIPPGSYDLKKLLALLNTFFFVSRIRFAYDDVTRKVVISRVQSWFMPGVSGVQYSGRSLPGRNTFIDTLLGFPDGWVIGFDPDFAIQSTSAVQPEFLPNTLMIAFSSFPSKVVSSSGTIGEIAIPYNSRTFDFQTNQIHWTENSQWKVEIECYQENIDHLGIRIFDSRTGERYSFMEEHTIQIEVIHADTSGQKPYPQNTINGGFW